MNSQRTCTTVSSCWFPKSALRPGEPPGERVGISTCWRNGFCAVSSRSLQCYMPRVPATSRIVATRGQAVYANNSTHPSGLAHPQQVRLKLPGSHSIVLSLLQPHDKISSRYLRHCSGPRYGSFKQRTRASGDFLRISDGDQKVDSEQDLSGRELGAESKLQQQKQQQLGAISDFEMGRLFVFGLGFTALALADYLKKSNWEVSGTCRSEMGRAELEEYGYSLHLFNVGSDGRALRDTGLRELQQASHWLVSIPPMTGKDRDPVLSNHWRELAQAVKEGNVRWIGYLSSTGVYGDWQGNWVDEESEPRPVEQKAVARLAAEKSWMKFGRDQRVPVHIFRLGGIYGPGRSALDTILRKTALSDQQQNRERRRFISRIHVEDVRQTLFASMRCPCPGRIYNVVDDDPAPRLEVVKFAKGLLEGESSFENSNPASGSVSLSVASDGPTEIGQVAEKRVSNKRMKKELKIQLLHPTYKSGLRAILEHAPKFDNSTV